MKKTLSLLIATILFSLPLVLAYNGWGYGGYSPSDLLEDEWVIFALILIVFFAIIFFSLAKTMRGNKGAAVVISAAISLFIAVSISQRTKFYGYFGEELATWFLVLALIIAVGFLVKLLTGWFGGIGFFGSLFLVWYALNQIEFYDVFSYSAPEIIIDAYETFTSYTGLGIIIILTLILLIASFRKKKFGKWFLGIQKKHKSIEELFYGD